MQRLEGIDITGTRLYKLGREWPGNKWDDDDVDHVHDHDDGEIHDPWLRGLPLTEFFIFSHLLDPTFWVKSKFFGCNPHSFLFVLSIIISFFYLPKYMFYPPSNIFIHHHIFLSTIILFFIHHLTFFIHHHIFLPRNRYLAPSLGREICLSPFSWLNFFLLWTVYSISLKRWMGL